MLEEVASIANSADLGARWVVEQSAAVLAAIARYLQRIGDEHCREWLARVQELLH